MKSLIVITLLVSSVSTLASEVLLGIATNSTGITFQVESGGCTDKPDFKLNVAETFPTKVTLTRTKMDFCEMYAPFGEEISYTWAEIKAVAGMKFYITNKIQKGFVSLPGSDDVIQVETITLQ